MRVHVGSSTASLDPVPVSPDGPVHISVHAHDTPGTDITVEPLSVTENGTYTAPDGTAYTPVNVAVPVPTIEALTVTENGTYTAPSGTAYSPVTVDVPEPEPIDVEPLSVTENGTYTAPSGTAYSPVTVAVPTPTPIDVEPLSVTENGTYTAPSGTAYSPVTVYVEASDSVPAKDVNFYDYDGTRVYAYTAAEFANLSAMPANPSHTGLTAQGWNWTLSAAQSYVSSYGVLEIGQSYVTESGATEIFVDFVAPDLSPYLVLSVNGTVSVDWGDGSTPDTLTGSTLDTLLYLGHTYASGGAYKISISLVSGEYKIGQRNSVDLPGLLRGSDTNPGLNSPKYSSRVMEVRIGSGAQLGRSAFTYCTGLKSISIPVGLVGFAGADGAFYYCSSLRHVTIPSGVGQIGAGNIHVFSGAGLESVSIPESVSTIMGRAFYSCGSLKFVTLPPYLTSVPDGAFYHCGLERFVMPRRVNLFGTTASPADGVFNYCRKLRRFSIPLGWSTELVIGRSTFEQCVSLEVLSFPARLTAIGDRAFYGCSSMREYHFQSTEPPTLGANAFQSIPTSCKIYVPTASVNTYKAASGWSTYANQIFGE